MSELEQFPTVSIIMPTYNRAGLIMESVESVRNQTYVHWELIIVDDGSDDETEELINSLADDRIKFVKAGRVGVGGRIKNIGIRQSTGHLIAFIDSDDLWDARKLQQQVGALQLYNDAGFCLTGGYNFKGHKAHVEDYFYKTRTGVKHGNVFVDYFNSQVAGFTQALLVRRACFTKVGYFKEEGSFSDAAFICRLAFHFPAVILYEPLVFRRLHDTNYITPNWESSYADGIELIKQNRDKLPSKISRNAFFRLYINFGEKCLSYNQRGKAIAKFMTAWRYRPFSLVPLKKIGKALFFFVPGSE